MNAPKITDFAQRLSEAMKDAGLTDVALAGKLGVSRQAVKKYMVGTSKMMAADNLLAAAKALNVDFEWLVTGAAPARSRWPFSPAVLERLRSLDQECLRRLENTLRASLDMDPLPKEETRRLAA